MIQNWTQADRTAIGAIAARQGFDEDAGMVMASALAAGGSMMAQFSHPALGGMGQWSQGGMLMIGDMFNQGLKYRVANLAEDLSQALRSGEIVLQQPSGGTGGGFGGYSRWWPAELGSPSSSGAQNDRRYAIFPDKSRVAVEMNGHVTIHDTGDHAIGGVSQQQGSNSRLTFSSQFGQVALENLPQISSEPAGDGKSASGDDTTPSTSFASSDAASSSRSTSQPTDWPAAPTPTSRAMPEAIEPQAGGQDRPSGPSAKADRHQPSGSDVFDMLRKLSELQEAGILSEAEFQAKKTELLARL